MKDLRPDLSRWLSLSLSRTLDAAKAISSVQGWCTSSQDDMEMCIGGARRALQMLDDTRDQMASMIDRAEALAKETP